jgi:two-component system, LytTR family, response regulator
VTIRAVIVDDEPLARTGIALMLASHSEFSVAAECKSGEEAVTAIIEAKPDLVFLDIQMPGMTGFDVLSSIRPNAMPVTIFLTAFDEYALAAFEVQALDYLLKPIDEDRFNTALARAREMLALKELAGIHQNISGLLAIHAEQKEAGATRRFVVRERGRTFFVTADEIDWIEAIGDYAGLHVGPRTHLLRESMGALEARLDPRKFVRIHRSAIVRLDRVAALQARTNRDGIVRLKSGVELRVSRTYSSGFRDALQREIVH